MEKITKYLAEDGSEWDTAKEAHDRDDLAWQVERIMRPMGSKPKLNSNQYLQHEPATVRGCQSAILDVCKILWPKDQAFRGPGAMGVHASQSLAGRIICDGAPSPLYSAWERFMNTGLDGREWQQPYLAFNPPANPMLQSRLIAQ